jgi:2-polyprenyl-6-methoxyphenol hydroxylase-like FAD-dependent oxidoreductase
VTITYYRDADSDTYGNLAVTTQACSAPAGYVANSTDCNDTLASVRPNATETCNGVDDDCDGSTDEGVLSTFYRDADGDTYGDPEELHRRFKAACEPVQTLLSKIETWRMWVLCDRDPVSDWSVGRVTLLGDAAHPMLQYMAQGACMAMEDAVVLAKRIEERPDDIAQALHAYQQDRYLRTCRVQLTARVYGDVYHAVGPVRELRNRYLQNRTPEQGLESLAWLYDAL